MNGTVSYLEPKRTWKIVAPPHVILRLKRLFPKVGKRQHDALLISDTEENARDIEWALARYPMTVENESYLRARAAEHRDRQALVDAMLQSELRAAFPDDEISAEAEAMTTKPWQETWRADGDDVLTGPPEACEWSGRIRNVSWGEGDAAARARLAAQAPAMARLLLERVDVLDEDGYRVCCEYLPEGGHADGCRLATTLRAAGVLP